MHSVRRLGSSPATVVGLGSAAILVVHTAWVVAFCWHHSAFANDDIRSFWRARTEPFVSYVLNPIDDHFVPLHRVVCYLVLRVAPMNFTVGTGILAGLHVGTLMVLWRILERLRPSPLNAVLVCLYGLQASLGPQFLWWTAGLGRLGCGFFSVLAAYFYLRFRIEPSRKHLVLVALSTGSALGFYAKGMLVPMHMAAVEIALFATTNRAEQRANALAIAALVPIVGIYLVVWRGVTIAPWHQSNLDPVFHARWFAITLPIFGANCLGFWLDDRLVVKLGVFVTWAAAILYSATRSRHALLAWGALIVCVAVHMAMVAVSALRAQVFGFTMARLDRYYFDAAFLVPIFVGIAFRSVARGSWERDRLTSPSRRWTLALVTLVSLSVFAVSSEASCERIQSTNGDIQAIMRSVATNGHATAGSFYPIHDFTRKFVSNLEASLDKIPDRERQPLRLIETKLPWYVMPWGDLATQNSELLTLMGQPVGVGPDGDYIVNPSGLIFDARRWRAAWLKAAGQLPGR